MQVTGSNSKYRHCLLDADVANSAKAAVRLTEEVLNKFLLDKIWVILQNSPFAFPKTFEDFIDKISAIYHLVTSHGRAPV